MYGIHIEFVCDIARSILGDNETARIWCQANAAADDAVRGIGVARRRMHIAATVIDTGQSARGQAYGIEDVPSESGSPLPNLRDIRIILYSVSGYAVCIFSNISGRPTNRAR